MTVDDLMERANSQIGLGIKYKPGGGAITASRHTCGDVQNFCDASSFVCWALGVDKLGSYPYLLPPGQASQPTGECYDTDGIWNDAVHISLGLFQKVDRPARGSVVVYPTTWKGEKPTPEGHVGIVTNVAASGAVKNVVHCCSANFKETGDAVQETAPDVFTSNPRTIYAWCSRVEPPQPSSAWGVAGAAVAAVALNQPVRFCVVAAGAAGAQIETAARAVAGLNPFGRRVVIKGDADFPDAASSSSSSPTAKTSARSVTVVIELQSGNPEFPVSTMAVASCTVVGCCPRQT